MRWLHAGSAAAERVVVTPLNVVARRSTELPIVARAVASGRHRLERAFPRVLGRTVQEEIRRVRVESAKRLLEASRSSLAVVATLAGFKTASLLTAAFRREIGMTPGVYRRRVQVELPARNQGMS